MFESIDISISLSGNPKTNEGEGKDLALDTLGAIRNIVESWVSAGYPVSLAQVRVSISPTSSQFGDYPPIVSWNNRRGNRISPVKNAVAHERLQSYIKK